MIGMTGVAVFVGTGITNTNIRNGYPLSLMNHLRLGLGRVRLQSIIGGLDLASIGRTTMIASVLLVNAPQPIFSMFYFLFNGLFTAMLLTAEWADFAHKRRPLRVSDPKPGQRSAYFLQLPYRYTLPLMLLKWRAALECQPEPVSRTNIGD